MPDTMPVVETYNRLAESVQLELEKLESKNEVAVSYDPSVGKVIVDFGDGTVKKINPFDLRVACMCAACIDEIDGR